MLYPLQRLLLAAQPQELFPLQLKQILLSDQRPARDVTAGYDLCNCSTQHLLIFGDEAAHPHVPELGLDAGRNTPAAVSYTHLRAHETVLDLVCRLLLEKK